MARQKKLVLSVHDMFMMTGHCTYAGDCRRWLTGCGDCPDLGKTFSMRRDKSREVWLKKYALMHAAPMQLVAGSPLLLEEVRRSPILRDQPVEYIPYGTDTETFHNRGRERIRQELGVPADAFVLCFRSVWNPVKGTRYIQEALRLLRTDKPICCLALDTVGVMGELPPNVRVMEFGWLNDQDLVADILSAADLLLMPSTDEGFGLLATEAMACGTPAIVFEGTALPATVNAPHAGVAVPRSSAALARAIQDLMNNPEKLRQLARNGIRHVSANHNFEDYAAAHAHMYERLMSQ